MSGDVLNGVVIAQASGQSEQCGILRISERCGVAAFEFDADGEIVAAFTVLPVRDTGVPGAVVARHKLNQTAVTADEEMR